MRSTIRSSEAVSPVVGVMLMLVVTIIIAAVVSAFAGGTVGGTKTTPQVAIQGTYSQTGGMTITNAGGDTVSLRSVDFSTTPSEPMGTDAQKFAYVMNKTILYSNSVSIYNATSGTYNTTSFRPGDTLTIPYKNTVDFYAGTDMTQCPWFLTGNSTLINSTIPGVNAQARLLWNKDKSSKKAYFNAYTFANPANQGQYFYLDMLDTSGSIIARAKVTIEG